MQLSLAACEQAKGRPPLATATLRYEVSLLSRDLDATHLNTYRSSSEPKKSIGRDETRENGNTTHVSRRDSGQSGTRLIDCSFSRSGNICFF
jgi:hypothetical protein